MASYVHPDYTDLVTDHLRRSLEGTPGLDRLEIELQPQDGQTARVELSAVRIDYQGGPALLLTMVEMGPRAAVTPVDRARAPDGLGNARFARRRHHHDGCEPVASTI